MKPAFAYYRVEHPRTRVGVADLMDQRGWCHREADRRGAAIFDEYIVTGPAGTARVITATALVSEVLGKGAQLLLMATLADLHPLIPHAVRSALAAHGVKVITRDQADHPRRAA